MNYSVILWCTSTRKLTEPQRAKVEAEIARALDDDATLPPGFDVETVTVTEE